MFRFIAWIFDREYEPCRTCVALREQIGYERAVNQELTETITSLLRPIPASIDTPAGIKPLDVAKPATSWSRRRAELERRDRDLARIKATSPHAAKPDTIESLEQELGIEEEKKDAS